MISGSPPSTLYEEPEDEYCEAVSYGVEAIEPVNDSRCLNEMAAAAGFSGMVIVRGGTTGLGWTNVGRERRKAMEGKKEEDECDSDLWIVTGDEMSGRTEDESRGFGAEMRGRESSNFRS